MEFADVLPLLAVALAAGWVDAVVGGGGLIQIPMLMLLVPGVPVAHALGTNKLAGVAGTSAAAITFVRRTKIDKKLVAIAGTLAVVFSGLGAAAASSVPAPVFRPIIMCLLVGVAAFVAFRPMFGQVSRDQEVSGKRFATVVGLAGVLIAFYDGVLGPGTGTFLIISFVLVLGMDFVHSSATAKVVNAGTNLGALAVFAWQGHVMWTVGAMMAVANMVGASIGARTALTRGAKFVRIVLLVVVTALVTKLGVDQFA